MAANFNKVILVGNLTRDPQVRYIGSGTAVCEIGLAVNRVWFDKASNSKKEETTFVDVTLWGRDAEVAGEYLAKGKSVLIEGRLKLDTWDDKATGAKRSKLAVVAESMQMMGSPGQGGQGQGGGQRSGGEGGYSNRGNRGPAQSGGGGGGNGGFTPASDYSGGDQNYGGGGGGGSDGGSDDVPF